MEERGKEVDGAGGKRGFRAFLGAMVGCRFI